MLQWPLGLQSPAVRGMKHPVLRLLQAAALLVGYHGCRCCWSMETAASLNCCSLDDGCTSSGLLLMLCMPSEPLHTLSVASASIARKLGQHLISHASATHDCGSHFAAPLHPHVPSRFAVRCTAACAGGEVRAERLHLQGAQTATGLPTGTTLLMGSYMLP